MDYKLKPLRIGEKDYNVKMILEFSDIDLINKWWTEYDSVRNKKFKKIDNNFLDLLKELYQEGYGYKTISASIPNSSYTKIRSLFNYYFKDILREPTEITESLKERRSERLLYSEDNPWKVDLNIKNSTGIQGYYFGKDGEKYWLRSSYEYIYVKWMEKNNIKFKVEPKKFKLSNGQYYTPDFSIYESDQLKFYVETKGKVFDNNLHKPEILKKDLGVSVIVIDDIEPYCERNYQYSLKEWKKYLKNTGQKVKKGGIK